MLWKDLCWGALKVIFFCRYYFLESTKQIHPPWSRFSCYRDILCVPFHNMSAYWWFLKRPPFPFSSFLLSVFKLLLCFTLLPPVILTRGDLLWMSPVLKFIYPIPFSSIRSTHKNVLNFPSFQYVGRVKNLTTVQLFRKKMEKVCSLRVPLWNEIKCPVSFL